MRFRRVRFSSPGGPDNWGHFATLFKALQPIAVSQTCAFVQQAIAQGVIIQIGQRVPQIQCAEALYFPAALRGATH